MTRPLALIVGAGVAGLTAAWWLDRAGWRSIIVERAPDLHDGGYMMGLSGQGYATACRMGLESALLATQAAILTQRDLPKYPYFIRTSWTSSQPSHPFGQWACDQGIKTVAAIVSEIADASTEAKDIEDKGAKKAVGDALKALKTAIKDATAE